MDRRSLGEQVAHGATCLHPVA